MDVEYTNRSASVKERVTDDASCRHHWIIDSPKGPTSRGVCRLCGEARDFYNYLDQPYWDIDITPERLYNPNPYPTLSAIGSHSVEEEER